MTITLTKGSMSVTLTDVINYYDNGDKFLVKPGPNCTITSFLGSGAVYNPSGKNQLNIYGATVQLPLPMAALDSFVVVNGGSDRSDYWPVPGRSSVMEALGIVFVPYDTGPGLLSPPAIGNGPIARFLRSEPIPESLVDLDRLPRAVHVPSLPVNWQAWGAAEPTIDYLTRLFAPFGGELYDGWSTDTRTPDRQHPGYGSYYASVVSQALVQLCSTISNEYKKPLAIALCNRALDLAGAFGDGRIGFANGGHCQGRKALIVLFGHLLDNRYFSDPNSIIGKVFQEDDCFHARQWWRDNWTSGWKFNNANVEMDGSKLTQPPSTWGSAASLSHNTFAWAFNGYLSQVVGCQVGTALAMFLMNKTREMGIDHFKMVQQYMKGPSPEMDAELRAAGINIDWGTDYALYKGATFCATAWNKYIPKDI